MLALTLLGCLIFCIGCVRKQQADGKYVVDAVELRGTQQLSAGETLDGLGTRETERLFGVPGLDGVALDYSYYDPELLERDLQRIERTYRARGYYEVKVTAARVLRDEGQRRVRVIIDVQEGQPVLTGSVTPKGLELIPLQRSLAAQRAMTLRVGRPFDDAEYERSKRGIAEALSDAGYAFVEVDGQVALDITAHRADVTFTVRPGPVSRYGPITLTGLGNIPESVVRDQLQLREGQDYSRAEVEEAKNALVNLGVFSSVRVLEDRSQPDKATVPITVLVEPAKLRTLRAGLGLRLDPVQFSSNLRIGWEDRNLLGGLRRFTVDERPGVVLYPTRTSIPELPTRLLPTNRLRTELRQPSFIEGRTTGLVSAEYNIGPLLFPLPKGRAPEDERILGFHELRGTVGLERSFWDLRLLVAPSLVTQANVPLAYQAPPEGPRLPTGIETLLVVYPELSVTLDLRDDRIRPRRGAFFSSSLQVPMGPLGSDAHDVRWRPEARTYLPLSRKVVLATRLGFGFLLPRNYGGSLADPFRVAANPTAPDVIRDQQTLLLRAFYSGGPNSNRGYGFSEVGPHGPLGLLSHGNVNCYESPGDPDCVRPLGGLTLWEASLELRFAIAGALGGVTFLDASDVTRQAWHLRLTVPHLSPGVGLRYDTAIGPLRLDLGYRWLERTAGAPPVGPIRDEAETTGFLGIRSLPMTLHLAIGESF